MQSTFTAQATLILLLLQQMCVYLVIAYLLSKTPLFTPLMQVTIRLPHKMACYVIFSIFCVLGTYFGLHVDGSIANTRATGAVLGGLLGGMMPFDMKGLDFALTALFVVLFLEQMKKKGNWIFGLIGIACALLSRVIFGAENMVLPALAIILVTLLAGRKKRCN